MEYFCCISTMTEPLVEVGFSNTCVSMSSKCCSRIAAVCRRWMAVHRSISKELELGDHSSTKNLSVKVRNAVSKGFVVGCCCWRSFAWEVILTVD